MVVGFKPTRDKPISFQNLPNNHSGIPPIIIIIIGVFLRSRWALIPRSLPYKGSALPDLATRPNIYKYLVLFNNLNYYIQLLKSIDTLLSPYNVNVVHNAPTFVLPFVG